MNAAGSTFIVFLAITLVVAVGWVLFQVGRVVVAIILEARSRQPPRQLQHPEFGTLIFEGLLWSGKIQRGGRVVSFMIAGSESGPDPTLIERLRDAIVNLSELERAALELIRSQEPEVRQGEFTFDSLDFLWVKKPDVFVLEFSLVGDDDGIWRVEFEEGRPKSVGRDD